MNKKLAALAVIVAVLLASFAFSSNLPRFQGLVPGPEGVRVVNYGLQWGLSGSVLKAATMDPLPSYFRWMNNQPSILSLKRDLQGVGLLPISISGPEPYYKYDSGEFSSEVQRPILQDDPIGLGAREVTYYKYVRLSDTQMEIRKVVVRLVPADFVIQLWVKQGSGLYSFKDINVWYALDTVVWLNSYAAKPPPDPAPLTNDTVKFLSSNYRGAFPVIAWIGQYKPWVFTKDDGTSKSMPPDSNAESFVKLEPDLAGRYIDLYTSPGSRYNLLLTADTVRNPEAVAQALTPNALPDPRFAESVYFKIRMDQFGAYVQPTGVFGSYLSYISWYPSVYYRLRVVYAFYGEYVYLWTAKTAGEMGYTPDTWVIRESGREEFWDPVSAFFKAAAEWLANPINQFWLLLLIIAVVVVAVSVTSPGVWSLLLQRRK